MNGMDSRDQGVTAVSEPVRHQVHHSYIWLGTLRVVLAVFVVAVVSMLSSIIGAISEGMHGGGAEVGFVIAVTAGISLAAFVIFVAIVFLVHWLAYKRLYYVLGPDEFNLYSGIITKKRVHVPYNKVQSVDQKASLLQRIAGVRTLYIDTAGGANNKAVVVPYVTKHDAEWLRSELFARKDASIRGVSYRESARPQTQGTRPQRPGAHVPPQDEREGRNILDVGQEAWDELGGVFAGEAYDGGRVSYEYGLSNKELVLAGLSNNTSFAVLLMGIVIGLVQIVGSIFDILPNSADDAISAVVASSSSCGSSPSSHRASAMAGSGHVGARVVSRSNTVCCSTPSRASTSNASRPSWSPSRSSAGSSVTARCRLPRSTRMQRAMTARTRVPSAASSSIPS